MLNVAWSLLECVDREMYLWEIKCGVDEDDARIGRFADVYCALTRGGHTSCLPPPPPPSFFCIV